MTTKTFMRGVHRCARHTCDICGTEVTVKGIRPPAGWIDLGVIGVTDILCCIDCGADVAEHVAEWLVARADQLEAQRAERRGQPPAAKSAP